MARDVNIGKPDETIKVSVQSDKAIAEALKEVTQRLDETNNKLDKLNIGQELILGQEIEEVE